MKLKTKDARSKFFNENKVQQANHHSRHSHKSGASLETLGLFLNATNAATDSENEIKNVFMFFLI